MQKSDTWNNGKIFLPSTENIGFKIINNYFEQNYIASDEFHLGYLNIHDGMKYPVSDWQYVPLFCISIFGCIIEITTPCLDFKQRIVVTVLLKYILVNIHIS